MLISTSSSTSDGSSVVEIKNSSLESEAQEKILKDNENGSPKDNSTIPETTEEPDQSLEMPKNT